MNPRPANPRRHAFIALDAVGAIMLLAILLLATAAIMTYHHKALLKLADRRAATRLAEETLLALQAGSPDHAPAAVSGTTLPIPAPPGFVWLDVAATVGTSQIHLTGLVPSAPEASHENQTPLRFYPH